ncbi:MAG: hypothetical protein AAGA67_06180, partial [Cyanobacteria bacterium P01_F01_bin.153]
IFLAGSGSTRQFIQRLGRILRKGTGEKRAILYEVIASDTVEERTSDRRRSASPKPSKSTKTKSQPQPKPKTEESKPSPPPPPQKPLPLSNPKSQPEELVNAKAEKEDSGVVVSFEKYRKRKQSQRASENTDITYDFDSPDSKDKSDDDI